MPMGDYPTLHLRHKFKHRSITHGLKCVGNSLYPAVERYSLLLSTVCAKTFLQTSLNSFLEDFYSID